MKANTTLPPVPPRISPYAINPSLLSERAANLPGMTGVTISELFPDIPKPISLESPEIIRKKIRQITLNTLAKVDLSKIQPQDSVNILASHHGFSLYGGEAYAEMLRTIRDEVEHRCHTSNIHLCVGAGMRFREPEEYIQKYELDKYFHGKAFGMAPVDQGLPIETEIGTFYAVRRAFSARWIIHAHNNDVRELHYHRQMGRLFKPFAMSYATIETRSTYHQSMGPRSANLIPRMIYDSPFVQEKFVCSVILQVAPTGIIGVNAHNDLLEQDKLFTRLNLSLYGKIVTLLSCIEEVILIIDYPNSIPYTTAGGILFCNFVNANVDEFDLDIPFTPFSRYTDALYPVTTPLYQGILLPPSNPAIKALIINYCLKGHPSTFFAQQLPTLVVGAAQADLLRGCALTPTFMDYAIQVEDLRKGVDFARRFSKTDYILAFDGAVGGLNVSGALAEWMHKLAPDVAKKVDNVLMPKWLRQRGIH
jgi:hypothetical protein